MPKERSAGKPTTRRYSPEEKAAAVRMVRALRVELGTEQGTVSRLARQLGYGVESVRSWVRQTDIDDGYAPGVSTAESARIKELEQEPRTQARRRDPERAASFFGAELDRQHTRATAMPSFRSGGFTRSSPTPTNRVPSPPPRRDLHEPEGENPSATPRVALVRRDFFLGGSVPVV